MADKDIEKKEAGEQATLRQVYDDTVFFIDSIVNDYRVFPAILQMMKEGKATVELKKRFVLRAIDEMWVNIIEDTLPSLDRVIRNPTRFIEEREELMPIETVRSVSPKALQHLSQHTDLIQKIDGDQIIPSKLLNTYKEETIQTYENKFINTLIDRLFIFVNRRYEIALKEVQDEKTTSLDFEQEFEHDDLKAKMHFRVEIAESADKAADKVEKNYTHTTDLWRRVVKLNSIVSTYAKSEFCQNMGKSYIHPPVMRTNAILKNKDMRQCLELWQFIESYENAGYSMLIQEDIEKVDDEYIKELYSTLALQYLIFRYNIHNEFNVENTLATQLTDAVLNPKVVGELSEIKASEFDFAVERREPIPSAVKYGTLTAEDKLMLQAIDISLDADELIKETMPDKTIQAAHIPEPEPVPEIEEEEVEESVPEEPIPEEQPKEEIVPDETPVEEPAVQEEKPKYTLKLKRKTEEKPKYSVKLKKR